MPGKGKKANVKLSEKDKMRVEIKIM